MMEVPPEPPFQADIFLSQSLKIPGMRNQLVQYTSDTKKNIKGAQK